MKRKGISIIVFVNLLVVAAVVLLQSKLPPEIPLFYGLPDGKRQLAPALALVIPNSLAFVITVANSLVGTKTGNGLVKKTLLAASVATTFLATVTTVKIILLVG